ncbi:MAG: hypothetical protein QOC85_1763 [Streptomyces sp.]|nr:hypothetical protein [Streptomyces sp.]
MERKRLARWLETVRVIFDGEPHQKSQAGRRQAVPFRNAVREELVHRPRWPRPRAALAVDFTFHTSARQPPSLWRLPKNYLDLLGETSAPPQDPGPVIYQDDSQVKLLYASLMHSDGGGDGRIYLEARTRASAIEDMQLAGELLEGDHELFDTTWAEADPTEFLEADVEQYLSADLAERMKFHDKAQYQAMLLGSNDRLLRAVFFQAARWLLTGRDADAVRAERLAAAGAAGGGLVDGIARTNADNRDLLWSTIRMELPPLPLRQGGGAVFEEAVRQAIRNFVEERPDLQPLIIPLRVTVLVVPPKHRAGRVKDLDNILITVLTALEEEIKPDAAPWSLAPPLVGDGAESEPRRRVPGSQTWAYQVLELHRGPYDPGQGSLTVVPGLGWNRKSIWAEAADFVKQALERRTSR